METLMTLSVWCRWAVCSVFHRLDRQVSILLDTWSLVRFHVTVPNRWLSCSCRSINTCTYICLPSGSNLVLGCTSSKYLWIYLMFAPALRPFGSSTVTSSFRKPINVLTLWTCEIFWLATASMAPCYHQLWDSISLLLVEWLWLLLIPREVW